MSNSDIDKTLPDIVASNLDILFIGYNPGLHSAATGHHYAGKSNRFWKMLYQSELLPVQLKPEEDYRLLEFGYGSTNIVSRPTKSAAEISTQEFSLGSKQLAELIMNFRPKIVCYVGFGVYRAFSSYVLGISASKIRITPGVQTNSLFQGIQDYICSNPSGLNTIPYETQLDCFKELKKLKERL